MIVRLRLFVPVHLMRIWLDANAREAQGTQEEDIESRRERRSARDRRGVANAVGQGVRKRKRVTVEDNRAGWKQASGTGFIHSATRRASPAECPRVLLRDICAVAFAGSPTPGRALRVPRCLPTRRRSASLRNLLWSPSNERGGRRPSVTSALSFCSRVRIARLITRRDDVYSRKIL